MMRFLGKMHGGGTLAAGEEEMGRADFDLDGFLTQPGEVVASGELRMPASALNQAFGRRDLRLVTDDGRVLSVRFSGKRLNSNSNAAHVDVGGELPVAKKWRR